MRADNESALQYVQKGFEEVAVRVLVAKADGWLWVIYFGL